MSEPAIYLTDDRDLPDEDQRTLVIFPGGNGDWYVQVAPKHGRTMRGVRICTSGGASTACPCLTAGIAQAYRAMLAAQNGEQMEKQPDYSDLLREVTAWRTRARKYEYDPRGDEIVLREQQEG